MLKVLSNSFNRKWKFPNFYFLVICVSRPKSASFSPELEFVAEAQPRLKTGEDKGTFWQRLNFLGHRTNCEAKDIYLFQIDKFINTY
jgi:hypothetical protein